MTLNPSDIVLVFGWPCLVNEVHEDKVTLINHAGVKVEYPSKMIKSQGEYGTPEYFMYVDQPI
jgi:hypothetical protein